MATNLPTDVPSRAHDIIVTIIVCTILSFIFVVVRLFTRYFINKAIGWDDYVAAITLPFVIAYGTILGLNTRYGMGLHQKDMPKSLETDYYKWIDIGSPFYILSLLGYKMSILLLYLRIYKVNKPFRYATFATMFIIFGYLFANFWTQLFACKPFDKEFNKELPGSCIDQVKSDYAYGSLNFITDLILFVLPMPMIWKLHLDIREKIGISLIFMVGSLNWAVAIVRFAYAVIDLTAEDRTWIAADTFLWSVIEVNTGLICSCMPVMKPFFRRAVSKTLSERSWSFNKGKVSWTGDTLRGDEDGTIDDAVRQKEAYLEVESGASSPAAKDRRLDGSVSTIAGARSDSERFNHVSKPPKIPDLETGKYGIDMADL